MTGAPQPQDGRASPGALVREGLAAALVLSLADVLATGPWRAPMALHGVVLGLGLTGGLAAGLLASPLRRRGLAAALVLVGAVALQGASVVSKELGGRAALFGAVGLIALACGATALHAGRRLGRPGLAASAGLVGVPAGSLAGLLTAPTVGGTAALLVGLFVPLALRSDRSSSRERVRPQRSGSSPPRCSRCRCCCSTRSRLQPASRSSKAPLRRGPDRTSCWSSSTRCARTRSTGPPRTRPRLTSQAWPPAASASSRPSRWRPGHFPRWPRCSPAYFPPSTARSTAPRRCRARRRPWPSASERPDTGRRPSPAAPSWTRATEWRKASSTSIRAPSTTSGRCGCTFPSHGAQ